MASIPSYVSMSQKVGGDDSNIQYDSLLSSHDAKRRYSERPPADALEAKHREKLFQLARKGALSDSDLRLEQWLLEKKGGRLIPPRKSSRAHSHQGVGLLAPQLTRSSSKRSTKSSLAAINSSFSDPRRRSSENPSHYRPSKTVLSDFEAAEILEAVLDAQKENYAGSPPPEKERRRIVIIVSVFALLLTFLAAGMVGITFGLSPILEEFHGYPTLNGSVFMMNVSTNLNYSPSLVDLNDENNILTDDSNKTNIN
ncbi:uncharacterized protein [Lepeophtheirus salmonis]|uniref:uncharacterized protein isoform X1 n=1 Tax=Lepeophtheirus salmonis TaxID=72036 RepID=UPI003AF3F00E